MNTDPIQAYLKIPAIPLGRRYWVVRADGGYFYQHFLRGSCIAIGHLDPLGLPASDGPFYPAISLVSRDLKLLYARQGRSSAQVTSFIKQVEKFIFEMQVGDWVVTPDLPAGRLLIGRITGHPRTSSAPIRVRRASGAFTEMPYGLRRAVQWASPIEREVFPVSVTRSLRANQTVFNVDEHWQALCHLVFPAFIRDRQFYLSFNIKQRRQIDSLSLSRFLAFLSEAELFSLLSKEDSWECEAFGKALFDAQRNGDLTASIQAQFMSPGDVNETVSFKDIGKVGVYMLLVASILFGNEKLGLDGVIDQEMRHKILDFLLQRWEQQGGQEARERLQLTSPGVDYLPLVGRGNDEEPRPDYLVQGTLPLSRTEHMDYLDVEGIFKPEAVANR